MTVAPYTNDVRVNLTRCIPGIDCTQAGVYDLMTTAATPYMPFYIIVALYGISGLQSAPTLSIGTAGPNWDDVLPISSAAGLTEPGHYYRIPIGEHVEGTNGIFFGKAAVSNIPVKCRIHTAAVATKFDIEVQIVGAYV